MSVNISTLLQAKKEILKAQSELARVRSEGNSSQELIESFKGDYRRVLSYWDWLFLALIDERIESFLDRIS